MFLLNQHTRQNNGGPSRCLLNYSNRVSTLDAGPVIIVSSERACAGARDRVERLTAAGILIGIDVVDHLILGDVRYWSFKEMARL